eukprot:11126480-Alexandrium_andersonii.AAC.1
MQHRHDGADGERREVTGIGDPGSAGDINPQLLTRGTGFPRVGRVGRIGKRGKRLGTGAGSACERKS